MDKVWNQRVVCTSVAELAGAGLRLTLEMVLLTGRKLYGLTCP